jgi:hypothetical protein
LDILNGNPRQIRNRDLLVRAAAVSGLDDHVTQFDHSIFFEQTGLEH